jgi:hypothetical protein
VLNNILLKPFFSWGAQPCLDSQVFWLGETFISLYILQGTLEGAEKEGGERGIPTIKN